MAANHHPPSNVGKRISDVYQLRGSWYDTLIVYTLLHSFADENAGLIYSITAPLMLVFASVVFCLFWIAYRHNYYYVQRNKVDTHGILFNGALSQVMAGVYVLEITLIGLFFLVRNERNQVACTPQAIIMIVALILTGEGRLLPLLMNHILTLCNAFSHLSLHPRNHAFSALRTCPCDM